MAAEDTVWKLVRQYGIAVVVAIAVATVIRVFFIEAYRIPSFAMSPTIEPGDTIFVAKRFFAPKISRDDVIIFSTENESSLDYIKRVVGMPGDSVSIRKGYVYVNGKTIDKGRPYQPILDDLQPVKVPNGSFFVIGDNRTKPPEGTSGFLHGLVSDEQIKGRAMWVWLSIEPLSHDRGGVFSRIHFERMFRRIH
jgi:signal peptidase I